MNLIEGPPKLLVNFAVVRYEQMQDSMLNSKRTARNLQPAEYRLGIRAGILEAPQDNGRRKGTLCQLINQTVAAPACLARHGFEVQEHCQLRGKEDNFERCLAGCPS